jgi:hypothetical protein
MKKVFNLVLVAGVLAITSCGPSAEEIAKKEQAAADSVAAVEAAAQHLADSLAAAKEQAMADSVAAARAQFVADSTAAAATKGKKK